MFAVYDLQVSQSQHVQVSNESSDVQPEQLAQQENVRLHIQYNVNVYVCCICAHTKMFMMLY